MWKIILKYDLGRARNRRANPKINRPTRYALGKDVNPLLVELGLTKQRGGTWTSETVNSEKACSKLSEVLKILGCPSEKRTGYLKYLSLTIEHSVNSGANAPTQ